MEGFEPPVPLLVRLISSQVHSTGLCHLPDFYLLYFKLLTTILHLIVFAVKTSGVRFGVPSIFRLHQPINSCGLVLGSEMGVPHDPLERPMPEQLCNRPQIHPDHDKSTCKSMAVAMPGVPFDLCLLESARDQPRDPCSDSPGRTEGNTGVALIFLPRPCSSSRAVTAIELRGIIRESPFLVLEDGSDAVRSNLAPIEAVLFTHPRPGIDGQEKVGQELLDRRSIAARRRTSSASYRNRRVLRLRSYGECEPPDFARSSHVDANSDDQWECSLLAIAAARAQSRASDCSARHVTMSCLLDRFHGLGPNSGRSWLMRSRSS